MATNPMLQAVLLFQNHQTTTPFMPVPTVPPARAMTATEPIVTADMAKPKEEKEEAEEEEENGGENGENEEEKEGEQHGEKH